MKIFHTSPNKITEISKSGIFGDVLFFANEAYFMTQAPNPVTYAMEISEESIINVSELYTESTIARISEYLEIDESDAERVLDGRDTAWDHNGDADADWYVQQLQAECAVEMGYPVCRSTDEQGVVYMICMSDKLNQLVEV